MPTIKNISPLGDLDVPLLDRVVEAGEEVDVSAEDAKLLLAQPDNFVKADKPDPKPPKSD